MNAMRYLIAAIMISTCVCWGSDQQCTVERFKLRATVQDGIVLQQFTGAVVQAHFDPRFALSLRIESVTPPLTSFTVFSFSFFMQLIVDQSVALFYYFLCSHTLR